MKLPNQMRKTVLTVKYAAIFLVILVFENSCITKPAPPVISEPFPQSGFCELSDEEIRKFVIELNIVGVSSSTAVATFLGGRLFILTNRHNLPEEVALKNIALRNSRYQYSNVDGIIKLGQDYALEKGLGPARDYAMLVPSKPHIFQPLPLHFGRHTGKVVIPSYAARVYKVGRGSQWHIDDLFDRLDVWLDKGASGAPVITCNGEIAGLYTALLRPEDFERAGFRAISTPVSAIISDLKAK